MENSNTDIKILILCGGKGERLLPITESIPKPLVKIQERPILSYLLSYFKRLGFVKFVIAVGYKSEVITQYFKNEHRDLEIEIVDSGDADIIRRIQDSAPYLPGDFILCYGDTLADVDLNELIQFHQSHQGHVSITVYPLQSQFGVLDIVDDNRVVSFVEKPVLDKWINIGYYYFSQRTMDQVVKYDSFVDFLQAIATAGQLYSYRHKGIHITVNTITELQNAERNITRFLNNNQGISNG